MTTASRWRSTTSDAISGPAEQHAPKTWLVQFGCIPFLFGFIRNGAPEVRYLAAHVPVKEAHFYLDSALLTPGLADAFQVEAVRHQADVL